MNRQYQNRIPDEETIRSYPALPLAAIKWLRETRGWSLSESKEFFENYRKTTGKMTYGYIFDGKKLPEKVFEETTWVWDQDYNE